MGCSEYVACVGEPGNEYRLFVRKPEGNACLVVLGAYGRIILKQVLINKM
jgi:hypothetical protein